MSKNNYRNYSKNYAKPSVEEVETPVVEPTPESVVTIESPTIGVVIDCELLNIRKAPKADADILTRVKVGEELMIDNDKSTNGWYAVRTKAGVDGYCAKGYVEI